MFTGIVEEIGTVSKIDHEDGNLHLTIKAAMASELKIDQSVSHNGACLTVVERSKQQYVVTAVAETLERTNLADLKPGDPVNLERGMKMNARLDGHLVQGHVDQTGTCVKIEDQKGSQLFHFNYSPTSGNLTIEKGSITVNGVSLTVVHSDKNSFGVAIIPYTLAHTNFKYLRERDRVNLEFDVIGKYVAKMMAGQS